MLASVSSSAIAAAATSSTTSASSMNTSSGATSTCPCNSSFNSCPSSSPSPTTVGLGVGIPLGALLMMSILFLLYRERQLRQSASVRPDFVALSGKNYSAYNAQPYEVGGGPRASELNDCEIRELDENR